MANVDRVKRQLLRDLVQQNVDLVEGRLPRTLHKGRYWSLTIRLLAVAVLAVALLGSSRLIASRLISQQTAPPAAAHEPPEFFTSIAPPLSRIP